MYHNVALFKNNTSGFFSGSKLRQASMNGLHVRLTGGFVLAIPQKRPPPKLGITCLMLRVDLTH
jgi:hypothetical protein